MSPVWFIGSILAYDLSLPRVRERFEPVVAPADWALAELRIGEASALLGRAGTGGGRGGCSGTRRAPGGGRIPVPVLVRDRVLAAADAFETCLKPLSTTATVMPVPSATLHISGAFMTVR